MTPSNNLVRGLSGKICVFDPSQPNYVLVYFGKKEYLLVQTLVFPEWPTIDANVYFDAIFDSGSCFCKWKAIAVWQKTKAVINFQTDKVMEDWEKLKELYHDCDGVSKRLMFLALRKSINHEQYLIELVQGSLPALRQAKSSHTPGEPSGVKIEELDRLEKICWKESLEYLRRFYSPPHFRSFVKQHDAIFRVTTKRKRVEVTGVKFDEYFESELFYAKIQGKETAENGNNLKFDVQPAKETNKPDSKQNQTPNRNIVNEDKPANTNASFRECEFTTSTTASGVIDWLTLTTLIRTNDPPFIGQSATQTNDRTSRVSEIDWLAMLIHSNGSPVVEQAASNTGINKETKKEQECQTMSTGQIMSLKFYQDETGQPL